MLIIDGCDNIGKTTLAKLIVKMANEKIKGIKYANDVNEALCGITSESINEITYRHMTRPPDGWDYFHGYRNLALGSHFIVQDRFHLGTLAYDDTPKYTKEQLRIIESWVYSTGSLIVILTPNNYRNYEVRLRSKKYSKEEMFDVDRMLRANTRYIEINNNDFSTENKFGINPTFDYCYEVAFEEDGSFCKWQTDRYWNDIAIELVEEWFKRIKWA